MRLRYAGDADANPGRMRMAAGLVTPIRRSNNLSRAAMIGKFPLGEAFLVLLPTAAPIFAGALRPLGTVPFVLALVGAIGALLYYFWRLRHRPAVLVTGLLVWLSLERFAVATMSPWLEPADHQALLSYKEAFFPALALVLLPRAPGVWLRSPFAVKVIDVLAVAFGVLVLVALLTGDGPEFERVLYARRVALLPLVYGAVRLLPWEGASVRGLSGSLVIAGLALALFGFLEWSPLESIVWRDTVPAAYYYHVATLAGPTALGTDFPRDGLPVVFFDFGGGIPRRRLVSTFLEPTTLSSYLAFSGVLAGVIRPFGRSWYVVGWLIVLATVLTLGKAGLLILTVGAGYVVAASAVPRLRDPAWLLSIAVGLVTALLVVATALERAGDAPGVLAHFTGLKEGIQALLVKPFGHGLGIGGNFGSTTVGAESAIGVIMVQLGFPGLMLWSIWMLGLATVVGGLGQRLHPPLLGPAVGVLLIAFFGTAALTESAGGYLGNWAYAALAGALVTAASSHVAEA